MNNCDFVSNLNLKVILTVELELASYAISLLMVAGAYRVVTLCAQLTSDLLAIS